MTKQVINTGQSANDKSGDPLRVAFTKINENFTELYSIIGEGAPLDLTELVQDYASEMLLNGNHDGVTVTYSDNDNKINITMNDIDGGGA